MRTNPHILKAHRAYYGGEKPRRIEKRVPNGRCFGQRNEGDHIYYMHPGNGPQRRRIKERWWIGR